jgi:hypothetical protein
MMKMTTSRDANQFVLYHHDPIPCAYVTMKQVTLYVCTTAAPHQGFSSLDSRHYQIQRYLDILVRVEEEQVY